MVSVNSFCLYFYALSIAFYKELIYSCLETAKTRQLVKEKKEHLWYGEFQFLRDTGLGFYFNVSELSRVCCFFSRWAAWCVLGVMVTPCVCRGRTGFQFLTLPQLPGRRGGVVFAGARQRLCPCRRGSGNIWLREPWPSREEEKGLPPLPPWLPTMGPRRGVLGCWARGPAGAGDNRWTAGPESVRGCFQDVQQAGRGWSPGRKDEHSYEWLWSLGRDGPRDGSGQLHRRAGLGSQGRVRQD